MRTKINFNPKYKDEKYNYFEHLLKLMTLTNLLLQVLKGTFDEDRITNNYSS